jgi:multidrug efflux pump subunit AcrA (membrane-fusion protein)
MMRRDKPGRPWHLYLLGLVAIVIAVLAAIEIGPPGTSGRTARQVVTAEDGIVQSTVTGTGNVEAGTDVNVNFQTSGTLSQVFVSVGQHVNQGQLLATLESTNARLTVDQAQESLTSAQDELTALENGTAASGSGSGAGSGASSQTASLQTSTSPTTEFVSLVRATRKPSKPKHSKPAATPTRTVTVTVPARTAPGQTASHPTTTTSATPTRTTAAPTTTTTTPSPSSVASAQAAVYSAEANLHNAQQALANTSLYAPVGGTIVSLAGLSPGDPESAGNSGAAANAGSSSSSGGGGGGGGAGGGGAGTTAGSLAGASSGSSSSGGGSSGTAFAQIVDTSSLTMTVAFSESDITKVAVGQSATVTMDALTGVELAAHVSSISATGTTSSGVVSYAATLILDQADPRVKPGMSASASVITGQAQGVTVPNQAVTGTGSLGTVDMLQNGKTVQKQVIVGLRGDSRTQIVSGLSPGQQLVVTIALPALTAPSSSTTPSNGMLGGGRFGGGGFGGGGFGGRALFGGGGGGGG